MEGKDPRAYYLAKYQNLEDLPGVGPATASELRANGYRTVESIAIASLREMVQSGIGEDTAQKIITAARKTISSQFETASELAVRRSLLKKLTTGASNLDRLFNGGLETQSITEFYGEFGCHSQETLALTPEGEKDWRTLKVGDTVLGEKNGNVVQSVIEKIHEYDLDGYLYELKTRRYNLCITDNHTLYYKTVMDKRNNIDFKKVAVKDILDSTGYLKCKFSAKGSKLDSFNISQYIELKTCEHPEKSRAKQLLQPLDTNLLLELLGYYIADGSPLRNEYATYPTIRNKHKMCRLVELATSLNLDYSIYEESKIVLFHRDLGEYFLRCGEGASNKRIPEEIKDLDPSHLKYLFTGLMSCDGHHNGFTYYTSSKQLRDDFLILSLKLGLNVSWKPASMNKKGFAHRHTPYYINIAYAPSGYKRKGFPTKLKYKGKVWCLTTSTGNFFTVRGGQPTLSGNSGKSQICQQLCVTVQLPEEKGGLDGGALYIDTEQVFRPERVSQMAEALGLNPSDVLKRIVFAEAYSSDHQMILLDRADEIIKEHNIRLIIVDSLTGQFRAEYLGRENLAPRQQKLNQHLHKLLKLTRAFDAVAVVTNQVSSTPDTYAPGSQTPQAVGGNIVGHASHTRVYLKKGRNNLRIATITASPFLPEGGTPIRITDRGIESDEEV